MTGDERNPLELAADLLVFAPIGLAMVAKELLPELARRGRDELGRQVPVARIVGQFAVRQGQKEAGAAAERARQQVETLAKLWWRGAEDGPAPAAPATDAAPAAARSTATPAGPRSGPGAADLAIPEYDSLSASQVVPRLQGLTAEELEEVRAYEVAHRGRRTILGRIEQLAGT